MKHLKIQGKTIPALGFGTFELTGEECRKGVRDAIEIGYRHIDTARDYRNEQEVAQGIKDTGIDREKLWVTTKVWRDHLDKKNVRKEAEESLRKLNTEYIDLLLIHWPNSDFPLEQTLEEMFRLQEEGKTRTTGVSNFPTQLLKKALQAGPILTNQVEYHPYLGQQKLLNLIREHEMMLTAYSPVAQGAILDDQVLKEISEAYDKNPAQVALRWLMQQENVAAIPRSSSHKHRKQNFDIFDFELTREEMDWISSISRGERFVNPPFAPDWD
ncbi:MAG: aldo/keto reductase [Bacteroidia bacterium]